MSRFEEIQVSKIDPHAHNVRLAVGDVTELAASIKAQGILQPLLVAPHPSAKTKFVLLAGHRRLAAAKKAKLTVVPATVRDDLITGPQQVEAMLVENLQRVDLTVTEEAAAYQRLLDFGPGYTETKIAKATGRAVKTVKERVRLDKLTDKAKTALDAHQLTIEQGLDLVELGATGEEEEKLVALAHATTNWRFHLETARERKVWRERIPHLLVELAQAGVPVIDRPEGPPYLWEGVRLTYTSPASYQAAAERGLLAIVDLHNTQIDWVLETSNEPAAELRPLTPEEEAAQARRNQLEGDLATGQRLLRQYLAERVKQPLEDEMAGAMLRDFLLAPEEPSIPTWLLGLEETEDLTDADVEDALADLTTSGLLLVLYIASFELTRFHTHLDKWDDEDVTYWGEPMRAWRTRLTGLLGYELTDAEQAAIDYHQKRRVEAAPAADVSEAHA